MRFLVALFLCFFALAYASSSATVLRLATTTSVENSGLLKHLLPLFTAQHPMEIQLSVVGSGSALRKGRLGAVDLVWVHSPAAERKFVDQGYGIKRHLIMRNDFILAGPRQDPASLAKANSVVKALQQIQSSSSPFISRGDESGTNKKERSLWKLAGIDPYGSDWYIESGTGMSDSLKLAEQHSAYLLIDRATFLVQQSKELKILFEAPNHLANPYSVIAVSPEKHPTTNHSSANSFIKWLLSEQGQLAIQSYRPNDQQLYFPVAHHSGS